MGVRGDVRRDIAVVVGGSCPRGRGRARGRCPSRPSLRRWERPLRRGVLHGHYSDAAPRAPGRRRLAYDADARTCPRPGPGAPVAGRGCVVRVARRPAGVGSALPAVTRARVRGRPATRLLRPRRAPEPGTAELRVVLDAARSDPHARGVRGVRPERARFDGLRPRLLDARRPRLGRARPARPRPRDDESASAG